MSHSLPLSLLFWLPSSHVSQQPLLVMSSMDCTPSAASLLNVHLQSCSKDHALFLAFPFSLYLTVIARHFYNHPKTFARTFHVYARDRFTYFFTRIRCSFLRIRCHVLPSCRFCVFGVVLFLLSVFELLRVIGLTSSFVK